MREKPAESSSNRSHDNRSRDRLARGATELAIAFLGVSAAFLVEGYREQLDQAQQLRQATDGRAEAGPDAFYDPSGRLRPEFAVEMRLTKDFGNDLRRLGRMATSLRVRLEQLQLRK